jgi:hypothetical protein
MPGLKPVNVSQDPLAPLQQGESGANKWSGCMIMIAVDLTSHTDTMQLLQAISHQG